MHIFYHTRDKSKTRDEKYIASSARTLRTVRGSTVLLLLCLLPALLCALPDKALAGLSLNQPLEKRLAEAGQKSGNPVFMRIFKEERMLELWMQPHGQPEAPFRLFASYPICAMSGTLGPKLKQGDHQAPEGFYAVGLNQFNPHSSYHLSFNIGYPNAYDRSHGRTGNFIMVHGNCVSIGCYAMTDRFIEEIYGLAQAALKNGQPFFRIHIFPFRLDEKNMRRHQASAWQDFWLMLKPGYDYFEKHKLPPDIIVRDKAYVLSDQNLH